MNIDIRFEGDKFSPKKLKELTGLPLEALAEYGEISQKGRYGGKRSPYGLALLKVARKNGHDIRYSLNRYLQKLLNNKEAIEKTGVDEIIIDVETSLSVESEFSLDAILLNKISSLKARIDLHALPPTNRSFRMKKPQAF